MRAWACVGVCVRVSVDVELLHSAATASALITGEMQRLWTDGQTTTAAN